MPAAMQVKLLRFLNDGSYQPIGARAPKIADVRIVAATHRDLVAKVADGSFREDLYYRLKGIVVRTPALNERLGDVPLLAALFLRHITDARARFSPEALRWLVDRRWPGNVRELRSAVESAAALAIPSATGLVVHQEDLAFAVGEPGDTRMIVAEAPAGSLTLEQELSALERLRIEQALKRTGHNHTHAARELGLSRVGLLKKLDRMGLR